MDGSIPVKITGEGAQRLADLNSVLHDLQWVQVACMLAIKQMSANGHGVLIEALQTAAFVRYCRTFESTPETRFSLAEDAIETLPGELQQTHYECCAFRDQYIAHSGEDLVWNVPTAHVEKDTTTGSHRVFRITVEHYGLVAPSRESMVNLYELARGLISIVQDSIEKETSRALAMMNSQPLVGSEAIQNPAAVLKPAAGM